MLNNRRCRLSKVLVLLTCLGLTTITNASHLTEHFHKMDRRAREQQRQEWQTDMNFQDYSFRLVRRYTDPNGQRCREYESRSKSNPYRHGRYTVCEERKNHVHWEVDY